MNKYIPMILDFCNIISMIIFWSAFFRDNHGLMFVGLMCAVQTLATTLVYEIRRKNKEEH